MYVKAATRYAQDSSVLSIGPGRLPNSQMSSFPPLSTAYYRDGIDQKRSSALERRNIQLLEERALLQFNEVARVWRLSGIGETIVKSIVHAFPVELPGSRTGKVLAFR